ncbi:MAG: hypothetical protein H6632_23040 [Anaerolineales bacterium]|nr:hypothetical protein [Anaerolineales bacterium]
MLRKIMFVLVILFSALLPAAALADNNIVVQQLSFPVTLSDGNTYTIAGYLYYQGSYQNKPLQVLVHGGGYNHLYWDVPSINNNKYSYARYMAEENTRCWPSINSVRVRAANRMVIL